MSSPPSSSASSSSSSSSPSSTTNSSPSPFDEEFARLRNVSSDAYFLLLLVITAISMVLLVRLAGCILSLALLVLPAATAARFSRQLWGIMLLAVLITMLYNTGGLALSFELNVPTGPFIVVIAVALYALSFLARRKSA